MLTLLTPTGARQEAFDLCQKWMFNQNYTESVKWIIVDDCPIPTEVTLVNPAWQVKIIRPEPLWEEGKNTQARNLLEGLAQVSSNERVVIIEDDDYYDSEYLANVDRWLDHHDLVGESHSRYFNISTGVYKYCNNTKHASLCSTAVKGAAIRELIAVCKKQPKFIDIHLWAHYRLSKRLYNTTLCCGIKGLPGRAGIGGGHRMQGDIDFTKLQEWVGEDALKYYETRI